MANKLTYSTKDVAIVEALKANPEGLTIAEMNVGRDPNDLIKPGHITGAARKGLIEAIGEREIVRTGTSKVVTYIFVDADVHLKEDGKPFNYTDSEKEILAAAPKMEGAFTLKELSTAVGRKLTSGHINSLVKKGNFTKGELRVEPTVIRDTVGVYGFVKDIPADAEVR